MYRMEIHLIHINVFRAWHHNSPFVVDPTSSPKSYMMVAEKDASLCWQMVQACTCIKPMYTVGSTRWPNLHPAPADHCLAYYPTPVALRRVPPSPLSAQMWLFTAFLSAVYRPPGTNHRRCRFTIYNTTIPKPAPKINSSAHQLQGCLFPLKSFCIIGTSKQGTLSS